MGVNLCGMMKKVDRWCSINAYYVCEWTAVHNPTFVMSVGPSRNDVKWC